MPDPPTNVVATPGNAQATVTWNAPVNNGGAPIDHYTVTSSPPGGTATVNVMGELVDAEVAEVAGPKGRHDPNRAANRHGTEDGKVTVGGRRIPVRRPRVRGVPDENGVEHEVHLESYDTFASVDLLADHMVASMLAGLSGRRYQGALEPVGEAVQSVSSGRRSRRSLAGSSPPPPNAWLSSGPGRWTTSAG